MKRRTAWTIGDQTHPPDTLLSISLPAFLAGDRGFTKLFEPGARRSLQGFFWCGDQLILSILDELKPVFEALTPTETGWSRERITGLPDIGVANAWPLDVRTEESNGDLLASAQDPLTPPSLFLVRPAAAPELLKRAPQAFDPAGLVVTRHQAISPDGTQVPYVQVGPPGETGEAPVHLSGYGGFGISQLPYYNSAVGKLWLERGGTSVVANIRGGGEFGTAWHDAGRREGKRASHDDFAAVAADLVRRGVTNPGRIAAEGGSNGGILITNMLTRYPERFGALFCTIPLIDMRRYSKLHAGASWIAEYGDPDDPADWEFLKQISAYHTAVPGRPYPPILIATSRRDDRVHPGHARKMAAKLQAMGYEAYFYEPAAGGHGYGKDNRERASFTALGYNFHAPRHRLGRMTAGEKNEIRHILRAAIAAALGTGQRAQPLPQCARPARTGRPPRLRLRVGSRASLPRGIFALAGAGGVPRRGEPAHPPDPPRARHHATDDGASRARRRAHLGARSGEPRPRRIRHGRERQHHRARAVRPQLRRKTRGLGRCGPRGDPDVSRMAAANTTAPISTSRCAMSCPSRCRSRIRRYGLRARLSTRSRWPGAAASARSRFSS